MDIEAVIAEANAPKVEATAPEQDTQATSEEAQVIETNKATEDTNQETDDVSKKSDSELTPEQLAKREANRQSHLNRKLAKQRLRDENAQLKARLSELEKGIKPQQQSRPSDYPSENDYDSVIDYMKAVAKFEAKQELKAAQEANKPNPVNEIRARRDLEISQQRESLSKQAPEYQSLIADHSDYLATMPDSVQDAFYEADNAPLALYALMKEGRLEDLEDLTPARIAMEIGRAEERGKAYLSPQNKVTNAPTPMSPLKGTSSGSKSIYNMPVDQLLKHFNTR
jgi:hypothetical protein